MLPAEGHLASIRFFLEEREGDKVRLRLARESDAEFLLGLRLNPSRNQNISATSGDLGAQVSWMRAYGTREVAGQEAYFVIEVDGQPQGSLRLYDYRSSVDSFCWGSWIIRPGAPASTAYQSAILAYDLAFGVLGFARSHFDVRQANLSVWKFHEKMGARLVREDDLDRFYEYTGEDYRQARVRLQKFTQLRDLR
jgi:RimJ/RimL family protein N-acetyltransferase